MAVRSLAGTLSPDVAVPLIGLLGPFKAAIRIVLGGIIDGLEGAIEVLMGLYVMLLEEFMRLSPSRLQDMQGLWEASMTVYFALLGLFALGFLAMMQSFPGNLKTDPYRFGERAFLATIALFIVNPPGTPTSTFGQGAFAWVFEITNAMQNLYLAEASSVSITIDLGSIASAAGSIFATFIAFIIMTVLLLLSIIPAVLLMGLRQVLVYGIYGLFPLLALLWIVDVGPLKHANMVAGMLFKAGAILLGLGVIISGALAASTGLIGVSTSATGTTASTAVDGPTVEVIGRNAAGMVRQGVFASHGGGGFASAITTVIDVVASSLLVGLVGVVVAFVVLRSAIGDGGGGGASKRDADGRGQGSAGGSAPAGGGGQSGGGGLASAGGGGFLGGATSGGVVPGGDGPTAGGENPLSSPPVLAADGGDAFGDDAVYESVDFGRTTTLPKDHHEMKDGLRENDYLAAEFADEGSFFDALEEEYGERRSGLTFENETVATDANGNVEFSNDGELTADDMLLAARAWKQDRSGDVEGNLWEQANKEHFGIDTEVGGRSVPDNIDELELTENAEQILDEMHTASKEFIERNHEEMNVDSHEADDGSVRITLERGEGFRASSLARAQLSGDDREYKNSSSVVNFTAASTTAEDYASDSGVGVRAEVDEDDVVAAIDQLHVTEKTERWAEDPEKAGQHMLDAEIQVTGDDIEVEAGVWDDGDLVTFEEVAEEPATLGQDGHENMKEVVDDLARKVEQGNVAPIESEEGEETLRRWHDETKGAFDTEERRNIEGKINTIVDSSVR